ncbi:MAG: hypothetical protein KDD62_07090, partial [Bdellovibrionales bacterium]|nr:hypothetical protein [Bdellovibrionales bacterium]
MEAFDDKFPLGLTPDMLGSLEPPKMPCEIPYSQDMAKLGNRLIEQISMLRVQLEDVDDTNAHCILLDGVLNELRAHVTAGDSGFIELDIAELAPGFVFIVSTLPRNAPQTLLDQLNEVLATLDEHKAKYKNQLFRISLTGEQEDLDILAETLGDELSIIAEEYLAKKAAQYNFTRGSQDEN